MPDETITLNFAGEQPVLPLPTAHDAMRVTVESAQRGDMEGARLWLDIAAELRAGDATVRWREPVPMTREEREKVRRMGLTAMPDPADMTDQILDYRRHQAAPPSDRAVSYARARYRALSSGVRPFAAGEPSLVAEILQRADGDTQVMQVPAIDDCPYCKVNSHPCPWHDIASAPIPRTVAEIRDENSLSGRVCKNCVLDVQWIDAMGWTHDVQDCYIVACPMDMAYRR